MLKAETKATELIDSQVTVAILSRTNYQEERLNLTRKLAHTYNKICYITTNKPYFTIQRELEENGIDKRKFSFLDATPSDRPIDSDIHGNTIVIGSPNNLNEISIGFSQLLNEIRFEQAIFDSVETLGLYLDWKNVVRFIHTMLSKVRKTSSHILFLTTGTEEISKELYVFADKVMNLSDS
ncbi:MAG: hypothetical protein ACE1ZC_02075 [Nitrososphaerales archaeon]|nr:hypothetical protein [Nitrososphaerota archaeon]